MFTFEHSFDRDLMESLLAVLTKLNTLWMRSSYGFAEFGDGVSVHYSCEVQRRKSSQIRLGDRVYLAPKVWIDVAGSPGSEPKVTIGSGGAIGRRSTISARNQVILENDVLLAPSVLITDHQRRASNIQDPTHEDMNEETDTSHGRIKIERNCWLGINAVISCASGELNLGHHSVVGANSVVTRSFPPYSVIVGNPAKLVKKYDEVAEEWVKTNEQCI